MPFPLLRFSLPLLHSPPSPPTRYLSNFLPNATNQPRLSTQKQVARMISGESRKSKDDMSFVSIKNDKVSGLNI